MKIKRYDKDLDYSYALGPFASFELIKHRRGQVYGVFLSPDYKPKGDDSDIRLLCGEQGIPFREDGKLIDKLASKDNVYVVTVFRKYACELYGENPHVVLVEPSDMGNLGTIIRTGLGFNYLDYAFIGRAADHFDPRTVRASMGALFGARIKRYPDFDAYLREFGQRECYAFMLGGDCELKDIRPGGDYSLIFGNEAAGLPVEYAKLCRPVKIRQSELIDSLNLSIAAGIVMYELQGE